MEAAIQQSLSVKRVNDAELEEFIWAAFDNDTELVDLYDKDAHVRTIEDCVRVTWSKITGGYPHAFYYGVSAEERQIGYFVYEKGALCSFGLNKNYRNARWLDLFWRQIKRCMGNKFQCMLFSYNKRAINWLKKCGMTVTVDSVTVLDFNFRK